MTPKERSILGPDSGQKSGLAGYEDYIAKLVGGHTAGHAQNKLDAVDKGIDHRPHSQVYPQKIKRSSHFD